MQTADVSQESGCISKEQATFIKATLIKLDVNEIRIILM